MAADVPSIAHPNGLLSRISPPPPCLEGSDCEAIRGRGGAAILSLAEMPLHPDPLLARAEREQNCSSLAGTLRGSRAHAYARHPTIASSIGHSPPLILTAGCQYDSMMS